MELYILEGIFTLLLAKKPFATVLVNRMPSCESLKNAQVTGHTAVSRKWELPAVANFVSK